MAKLIIDIKDKVFEGDILVFRNGQFVSTRIQELLPELKKITELENKVSALEEELRIIKGE